MSGQIGDLALLSDCQTAALVTRDGSVDWWPGPRFDGPSVFARMLDPDAGHLSVRPVADDVTTTRAYVDGTLVLRTEHRTSNATLVVSDALALDPAAEGHEIGLDVPHALVRVLEAIGGDVDVAVEYVPRTEYGLVVPRLTRERGAIVTVGGPEHVTLTGADELELQRLERARGADAAPRRAPRDRRAARCAGDARARRSGDARRHDRRVAVVVAAARRQASGPLLRVRRALRARAPGPDLPAHRRARRGADDVAARDARRGRQLGLSLRVAARREPRRARPARRDLLRRGAALLPVDDARGGQLPRELARADRLRRAGRAQPRGARTRPPARFRRQPAGADRQRRLAPEAARRHGRDPRRRMVARRRPRARRVQRGVPLRARRPRRRAVAGARHRDVGDARPRSPPHDVEGHVLGRAGPRRAARQAARRARRAEALAS